MEESANSDHEKKKASVVAVRQMEIDDVAPVFHLGERLFTASEVPNLFRTWDEYEVINFFQNDSEFCLVAQTCDEAETIIGFLLGTTVTKSHSAWKYGYLVWLGVDPAFHETGVGSKLFKRFRDLMVAEGARMLLVDSEADNLAALHFFRKMGFGHPQEHIYLALNLDSHRQKRNGRRKNGNAD
ncbi:MAG: N-acetyltransferase [Syntrophobacteraceae bacterium]